MLIIGLLMSCLCLFWQSSAPVELTEAETEYAVNVVKHIFDRHVVLQYNCTNTIPEQLLENVTFLLTNFIFRLSCQKKEEERFR